MDKMSIIHDEAGVPEIDHDAAVDSVRRCPEYDSGHRHVCDRADSANELAEALKCLAAIPFEEFDWRHRGDSYPVMTWNGRTITLGNIKQARAALAKYRSRS